MRGGASSSAMLQRTDVVPGIECPMRAESFLLKVGWISFECYMPACMPFSSLLRSRSHSRQIEYGTVLEQRLISISVLE